MMPAERPLIIGPLDYSAMPTPTLKALRLRIRARRLSDQNPNRLIGVNALLQPAFDQILDAVDTELASREGV